MGLKCLFWFRKQQAIQPIPPWPDFGKRLCRAFVMELGRIRADNLPYDLPRHAQVPANLLDRLLLNEKRPANLGDCFHNQHSNLGLPNSRRPLWTHSPGVPIGCKSPKAGSLFHAISHCGVRCFGILIRMVRGVFQHHLPKADMTNLSNLFAMSHQTNANSESASAVNVSQTW